MLAKIKCFNFVKNERIMNNNLPTCSPFIIAVMVYRLFKGTKKIYIKLLHAVLHLAALVFVIIGVRAVFIQHNEMKLMNMYSIHSWVGIGTIVLFCMQVAYLVHALYFLNVYE